MMKYSYMIDFLLLMAICIVPALNEVTHVEPRGFYKPHYSLNSNYVFVVIVF